MRAYPFVLAALALVAAPASAQNVIELPDKTIDVVGLRRWTIPMIQDSLAKYSPGTTLASSACAVVLREKLGFADAAVVHAFSFDDRPRDYIIVVEPQDSNLVHYRPKGMDTVAILPEFLESESLDGQNVKSLGSSLVHLSDWRRDSTIAMRQLTGRSDSANVVSQWRFLDRNRSEQSLSSALRIMAGDSNVYNRMIAVAIASQFMERDSVLWALADMLREPYGHAKQLTESQLYSYVTDNPRKVDWSGAGVSLRHLLNGTSLFSLRRVMEMLVASGIDSSMARPLLAGGGDLLLDLLVTQGDSYREPARRLLTALRGEDLGPDPEPWRAWIKTL